MKGQILALEGWKEVLHYLLRAIFKVVFLKFWVTTRKL